MSRGNPAIEHTLNEGISYTSGPQWLAEHVLGDRWVLAVAGTHGKTTTSSMLAWLLQEAGLEPGFLIGGVPENFGVSARLGDEPFMVVEADEYDTAFFDKRSKFLHYRPRTLVLNNLEYDHADIFPDLGSIQRQFHHLVRTVPGNGRILRPALDAPLDQVLAMGCWTPQESLGEPPADWSARLSEADGSNFAVQHAGREVGIVQWSLVGNHNVNNALAAIAAAAHAGVHADRACEALGRYRNVKRRLEHRATINDITVYDDFAHHPSAIRATLDGLRRKVKDQRILAVLEPRSNTMRMGVHQDSLSASSVSPLGAKARVHARIEDIISDIEATARPGDHILIMSNGAFGDIHSKLIEALKRRYA